MRVALKSLGYDPKAGKTKDLVNYIEGKIRRNKGDYSSEYLVEFIEDLLGKK